MGVNSGETEVRKWDGIDTVLITGCVLSVIGGYFSPGFFGLAVATGAAEIRRYQGRKRDQQVAEYLAQPPNELTNVILKLGNLYLASKEDNLEE